MWTTRRRQREREAKSGIRLVEIRGGREGESDGGGGSGVVPAMKRRVRGRVAFRARRQITKTKPSIREETGGPAHSIALRGVVHTHVPSSRAPAHHRCCVVVCVRTRVLAAGFTVSEPGSLRSRLRFGVTRPRSKRKRRLSRRDARGLALLLCGLDVDLPNGPTISTLSKSV